MELFILVFSLVSLPLYRQCNGTPKHNPDCPKCEKEARDDLHRFFKNINDYYFKNDHKKFSINHLSMDQVTMLQGKNSSRLRKELSRKTPGGGKDFDRVYFTSNRFYFVVYAPTQPAIHKNKDGTVTFHLNAGGNAMHIKMLDKKLNKVEISVKH